jgi:Mrp family chromosome partitioning ATPase
MTDFRPSLVERAAEIYDFASGLPVSRAAEDLPPRRPRALPAAAAAAEAPAPAPLAPAAPIAAPTPAAPARPQVSADKPPAQRATPEPAPVRHVRAELDRAALARGGFLVPDAPASGLAEEVRLIKRRLLAAVDQRVERGDEQARIVLVASGQPGEGKTFLAANLAFSIAGEQDRSVLLVDGDSSKPDLLVRIGLEEGSGFVDALADRSSDVEALVIDTDIDRLSVLPAGRKERNIPELLASARTDEVFERLLAADPRRIIVIDSPPVLAASPAAVLAGHAGQALVVVRADQTSEADLKETIDLLSACEHLSLVLNSAAFQVGSRRFGKYEEYR